MRKSINKLANLIREKYGLIPVGLIFLIWAYFIIVRGDNISIGVLDNLDGLHPMLALLKSEKMFFTYHGEKLPMLGGQDRNYFWSNLRVYAWFYMLLPPFYAFITAYLFKIALSIVGFVMLFREVTGSQFKQIENVVYMTGLSFGLLPVTPTLALGVAYLPFLVYFVIKLYREKKKIYIIGIAIYAIFADLVFFGLFACFWMLCLVVWDWIKNKQLRGDLFLALICMSGFFLVCEWRLLVSVGAGSQTIRQAFALPDSGAGKVLSEAWHVFVNSHYHSDATQKLVVFPVCVAYFIIDNANYIIKKQYKNMQSINNLCFGVIVFDALIWGLDCESHLFNLIKSYIPVISNITLRRFLFLSPFVWYFLFGYDLYCLVIRFGKKMKLAASAVAVASIIAVLATNSYYNITGNNIVAKLGIAHHGETALRYNEFYAEDLFDAIKEDINYDGEWSVAYGFHPSVLYYNGIHTLDGYLSYYPQEYKDKFAKLIEPYRQVGGDLVSFDGWGARAYVFGPLSHYPDPVYEEVETDIYIDPEVFREMGGRYVFSRVPIGNADDMQLIFRNVYENDEIPYRIFLYEIAQ